jgi:hypothetical protein
MASMLLGRYNFFQIGRDHDNDEKCGFAPFSCKPLFSNGQVVFITPQVMEHQPEKALAIVSHLSQRNKGRPDSWRLYTRPGIDQWLRNLADTHYEELKKGDQS